MPVLSGIHPVAEALQAGRPLERLLIAQGAGGARLQEIIDLARRGNVPVRFEPRAALDRLAGTPAHQGVVAMGAATRYADPDAAAAARLVVVLDGVEDPHNLGAIVRTAYAAGAGAVVIPERRAASLTDVVAKAAAGALEHLPVVRVANVNRALEGFKQRGFWIYGLDERGSGVYTEVDYASPTVLVLGGEGKGLHEQVRKHCDLLVRIPMAGRISSLNVSVAAGVFLFEWRRRQPATR
jgi:23S rRNA (guanosine2251-2'-O)-methyltransferase